MIKNSPPKSKERRGRANRGPNRSNENSNERQGNSGVDSNL